jgi:acetyl-CoA carboxylase carboxyltransferase component
MSWQPEIDEMRDRRLKALAMGGPERVARQHAQGKLSARERIARLLDQDSFTELGMLATHQSQRPEMQGLYTAADGVIMGYGRIDGREVLVGAEDFTDMVQRFPEIRESLEAVARERLEQNRSKVESAATVPLENFLAQGLMEAQSLLVLDLEKPTAESSDKTNPAVSSR